MTDDPNTGTLYCVNHPDRETYLRCNRCERPICSSCAVLTPTGYRCKDCVRGQQKVFDTARPLDYPIALVISAAISYVGSLAAPYVFFFILFVAPIFATGIAEAVRWATRRRRSRALYLTAAAGAVLGSLPALLIRLFATLGFLSGGVSLGALTPLIWQALYTILVTSTVYYRLMGIRVK